MTNATKKAPITFENVGKLYLPDRAQSNRHAFRDLLLPWKLFSSEKAPRAGEEPLFNGISFEVAQGQRLGIIGGPSSGKSVIAKMIGGMVLPDVGKVRVEGHPLLINHMGKTFKPMLTVQENARALAAISGMPRKHLDDVVAQAVEFAGLKGSERRMLYDVDPIFIKQLGLSVLLFCEGDILVVDDLFAVGSEEFRLRAMPELARRLDGKTAVLLSDTPELLRELCDRVAFLENGKLVFPETIPLPPERSGRDIWPSIANSETYDEEGEENSLSKKDYFRGDSTRRAKVLKKAGLRKFSVENVKVDGREAFYRDLTVLVEPGQTINLSLQLRPLLTARYEALLLALEPTASHRALAVVQLTPADLGIKAPSMLFLAGHSYEMQLTLKIPDINPGNFGVGLRLRELLSSECDLVKLISLGVASSHRSFAGTVRWPLVEAKMTASSLSPRKTTVAPALESHP